MANNNPAPPASVGRALNFAAYTNRAMVANEVAIGQLIGMMSMVDEIKTSGEYIDGYADVLFAIAAILGPIPGVDFVDAVLVPFAEMLEEAGIKIKRKQFGK